MRWPYPVVAVKFIHQKIRHRDKFLRPGPKPSRKSIFAGVLTKDPAMVHQLSPSGIPTSDKRGFRKPEAQYSDRITAIDSVQSMGYFRPQNWPIQPTIPIAVERNNQMPKPIIFILMRRILQCNNYYIEVRRDTHQGLYERLLRRETGGVAFIAWKTRRYDNKCIRVRTDHSVSSKYRSIYDEFLPREPT